MSKIAQVVGFFLISAILNELFRRYEETFH